MDRHKILSQPLKIYWAGWETDTFKLQSEGWDISAQQNIKTSSMRLALRYKKASIQGLTSHIDFDYFRHNPEELRRICFTCQLASNFIIQEQPERAAYDFQPIDARPVYTTYNMKNLEDFAHFKTVDYNTKEVFLKQANMSEILEMALQKQEPNQEKIRQQLIHREKMESIKRDSQLKAELRLVA
ncbi:MAG: hypothetical protein GY714_20100 [Desulfobacterales bacterium]|nr:hypothetical protein [Desulfobacterales bacterium]